MTDNGNLLAALPNVRPGVHGTRTGLKLPPDLTIQEATDLATFLGALRDWTAFAIGDLLLYSERAYGEEFAQIAEATGRAAATLVNYRWVAEKVVPSRRRVNLSFSHHEAVAGMAPDGQREWLARAERERLSVVELREHVRHTRVPAEIEPPARAWEETVPEVETCPTCGRPINQEVQT